MTTLQDSTPAAEQPPRRSILWPGIVFLFIGIQACWMSAAVYYALSDKSFSVEPDYYSKAVNWENTQHQAALNTELGWQAQLQAGAPDAQGQRLVQLALTTRDGQPVDGAQVEAVYYHRAHAGDRETVSFAPAAAASGGYTASLPMPNAGVYEFRIRAATSDVTYTQIVVYEALNP